MKRMRASRAVLSRDVGSFEMESGDAASDLVRLVTGRGQSAHRVRQHLETVGRRRRAVAGDPGRIDSLTDLGDRFDRQREVIEFFASVSVDLYVDEARSNPGDIFA